MTHRDVEWKRQYHREYSKKWSAANPERMKAATKRYRERYPEKVKERRRTYAKEHPTMTWSRAVRSSHKRLGYLVLFDNAFLRAKADSISICEYCGTNLDYSQGNGKWGKNRATLDRINTEAIIAENNIAIVCWRCNKAKSDMTLAEFSDWIKRINEKIDGFISHNLCSGGNHANSISKT